MSIEHYTYELKKSRIGKYLGNKVAIREDWVKRTRRYVVASGLDLNALATFVKKGLYDRRLEGFNEKALEEPLSEAQRWTLMWIILSDFGVPEWLRDESRDELVPEMTVAEPEEDDSGVVSALVKPVAAVGGGVATVGSAAAGATVEAGKSVGEAALSVAAIPVKSLGSLVSGTAEDEAEAAIAEAEETIAEAVEAEAVEAVEAEAVEAEAVEAVEAEAVEAEAVEAVEAEAVEAEAVEAEAVEDAGDDQGE